jgi:predicted enzyme related to lactoylglutathione lyase
MLDVLFVRLRFSSRTRPARDVLQHPANRKKEIAMSDTAMKQAGAFSWNELLTTDVQGAKAFYGELLGWGMQDIRIDGTGPGSMDYTLVKLGDKEIGGIMAIPAQAAGMPPTWGAYVTVSNVDALLPRVEKLGGKVRVPPQDIPDVGRFAVIQDPQGAMLSLISYLKQG